MGSRAEGTKKILSNRLVIFLSWAIAIILGALHAWVDRQAMNPDGISYLDMGDAYLRGDWAMAINAHWSPFYSWLLGLARRVLKPSPSWEFSVVHLVNFLVYLGALACFHFFLMELVRYYRNHSPQLEAQATMILPEWAFLALGYSLFLWSSLNLITIKRVGPDMCVAAIVYLALGILLWIKRRPMSWLSFIFLGILLGIGYLAKSPMFALAFIFLGMTLLIVRNFKIIMPRVALALILFLAVSGPFIFALSKAKGRLTISDTPKLNYAWNVNFPHYDVHWQGQFPKNGKPLHPPRKIFDNPAIYEFGSPIRGTYPVWYDPSYWHEGLQIYFDLKQQLRVFLRNIKTYSHIFSSQMGLIVGCLILFFMGRRRWDWIRDLLENWILFLPSLAALGMFSLVLVEPRYIGGFIALLWIGIISSVRLPHSPDSKRLASAVTLAMIIALSFSLAPKALSGFQNLIAGEKPSSQIQWQIAKGLSQMGARPGDRIAFIGDTQVAYWARLAKVQIIAEIPYKEADKFWQADNSVKSEVIKKLESTGVKMIVAEKIPCLVLESGWQRIGNTNHFVYSLAKQSTSSLSIL
jgi:hypothetical protein